MDSQTQACVQLLMPAFQDLHQVAAQMSKWLVMREDGASEELRDQLVLAVAAELLRCSREDIEAARPTAAARGYHAALLRAAGHLDRAFSVRRGAPAAAVWNACFELERASELMPGSKAAGKGTPPKRRPNVAARLQ